MFDNNSDSALEDLALHDVVPGTFSIENSSVRSSLSGEREASTTKESAREGTHVTWAIGRIEKDERIEVVYVIQEIGSQNTKCLMFKIFMGQHLETK